MFLFEFRAIFCTQSAARQRLWARDTSWDTIMAADPGSVLKISFHSTEKNLFVSVPNRFSMFNMFNVTVENTNAGARESTNTSPVVTAQFAPSTMTSTQNARFLITCVECRKPRVMYSLHKLTERQKVSLVTSMSKYDYTCGAPVLPPSNTLHSKVMVRAFLTCSMPVEIPYYG